jgi:ATP-dependent Clp protease ATP-binding subunit ClpC
MFERFTDQARRTVVGAQQECRRLGNEHIDTEHLLLALLAQPDTAGGRALVECGVDTVALRGEVEGAIGPGGREAGKGGHIPFTPASKGVLEASLRQALRLGHKHIGTGHILLGLLTVEEGGAAAALRAAGVDPGRVAERIEALEAAELSADTRRRGIETGDVELVGGRELAALRDAKDAALDRGDFEAAARLRAQERELLRRLTEGAARPARETGPEVG